LSACLVPFEITDGRLDELLTIWERWMRESTEKVMGLGYPAQATGCHVEPWGYWEDTAQLEYEAMEYGQAESINAAIEDLEPLQRMAIHHEHLAAVFRFVREDIEECYCAARQALRAVLPMRGVY
jgi:hypothetical protein